MHQPTYTTKQSAQTVIADLEAQKVRLTEAISWTRNVAKGIGAAGRQVTFSNAGPIEPGCREVGIVFSLAASGFAQDVMVFTLVCTPDPEEIAAMRLEMALAGEAIRVSSLIHWQSQGIRVFETWLVPEKSIWQGTPEATQVFLVKAVQAWLSYWFENPPKAVFRPRQPRTLSFQPIKGPK